MGETATWGIALQRAIDAGDKASQKIYQDYLKWAGGGTTTGVPTSIGTGIKSSGTNLADTDNQDDQKYPVESTQLTDATNIYNQISAASTADLASRGLLPGQGPAAVSTGGPAPAADNDTWRFRTYAEREAAKNRTGGVWPADGAIPTQEEVKRIGPAPTMETVTLDLPDYKPPSENKMTEKKKREELYQRGRGDLASQVHNAIISAKSLDNPNARAMFIREALRGMGQGLNEIMKGASSGASQYAARKRAEELGIYNAKFQAQSQEVMANYDAELQQAAAQWQADMTAWSEGEKIRRRVTKATDGITDTQRNIAKYTQAGSR